MSTQFYRLKSSILSFVLGMGLCAAPNALAQVNTLEEAIAAVYKNNPELTYERATLTSLDADLLIAKSVKKPEVNLGAGYNEFLKVSPNSFTAPQRLFQIGPEIVMPIYDGGRSNRAINSAKENVNAGQFRLKAVEVDIINRTVTSYLDVVRDEALVKHAIGQVNLLTETKDSAARRQELGDLTLTDVAQAEGRLVAAENSLEVAKSNLTHSRAAFTQIVGEPAGALQPPRTLPTIPKDIDDSIRAAVDDHPNVMAAKADVLSARENVERVDLNFRPKVDGFVNGAYTNYFGTLGGPISSDFRQSEVNISAGVRLTVPLYQGGRLKAERARKRADLLQAESKVTLVKREVRRNLESVYFEYNAAQRILKNSQRAIQATKLSLKGVQAEESVGMRTVLDVLNAQQDILQSRIAIVEAQRNAFVAGFNVLAQLGELDAKDLFLAKPTNSQLESVIFEW